MALVGARAPAAPCLADVWTGLGVVTLVLLAWSLFAGIDGWAWAPLVALAAVGWTLAARSRPVPTRAPTLAWVGPIVLVVWLANLSLGETTAYDSGLYHLASVDLASGGPAVAGLGNLHIRLSSAGGHLLMVALLGIGPWRNAGQHLANGLLLSLLALQLGSLVTRKGGNGSGELTRRVAVLLFPALIVIVAADPAGRVSSPSLDVATLATVVAGGLLLARAVELSYDARYLVAGGGALGTAVATRPQVVPAVVAASVLLVLRIDWARGVARVLAFALLPLACLVGALARQTVLSGYPLFPLSRLGVDVDWRLDATAVDAYRATVESWARRPGDVTGASLAHWGWLPGWAERVATDLDVAAVLLVGLLVPPLALLVARARRPVETSSDAAAAMLLLPSAATVAFWFLTAPDTRFAYGSILLLLLGLVAWVLPAMPRARRLSLAVLAVLWAAAGIALVTGGDELVDARGSGPFGTFEPSVPQTAPFTTRSGLVVQVPVEGDRCWRVPLCTPTPQPGLVLRGTTPADGFRLGGG